jgi:oligoribonuclease
MSEGEATMRRMTNDERRIAWVDVETTDLNPRTAELLAVGCIITDGHLHEIAHAEWIIYVPETALTRLPPVVLEMHTKSGLLERVRASTLSPLSVRLHFASFLDKWTPAKPKPILAGSSVHFDRAFLEHHFGMGDRFHHRHLDVSTLRVLAELYAPEAADAVLKAHRPAHLPLQDLEGSMDHFGKWRELLFRPEFREAP